MGSSETQDLIKKPTTNSSETQPISSKQETTNLRTSLFYFLKEPFQWLQMLSDELNPSFVFGVVLVYGLSQGFAGSFFRVVSDYYWKDVQKVQPSAGQLFTGLYYIPWIMKPVWGVLTDVIPCYGYKRRPYFVLAGVLGTVSALIISIHSRLPVVFALACLIGMTGAVAIADVTIDACIARNSIERPVLAADMQSLCGFCSSVGALLGYSTSGMLVQLLGAQGALGLLVVPPLLLILLGFVIYELRSTQHSNPRKVIENVGGAISGMVKTIKCPQVWKPSLYMYLSLALSISTHEGQFYWYTDPKAGPAFSKEFIGIFYAIGAVGSIIGVLVYHKFLKDFPFRNLLFFAQLFFGLSGMLDLMFVLRLNLKLGIPDYTFVVIEEVSSRIISKVRWMPMMVLSSRLCPPGIEGTFFALLMCIDSLGSLSNKCAGGLVLHLMGVTRTNFKNLWLAVLVRNLLRISTLGLIFLVPKADQLSVLLPSDLLSTFPTTEKEEEGLQLVTITNKIED